MKKAIIIGSGFSGLSTAAFLAKSGFQVTVIEKNNEIGGRARVLKEKGYSFDMGPSWYWMPDIFDNFFSEFDKKTSDFYSLIKLNPGFKMIFEEDEIEISSDFKIICKLFEKYENGAGKKLECFIEDAKKKYNIGIDFLYKSPGISVMELFRKEIILNITNFALLKSYQKHIKKYFHHPYLINLLEFPVIFLGSSSDKMPALYSLMAYSAIKQGTFYPKGGMNQVITGMTKLCTELGVEFLTNEIATKINIENKKVISVFIQNAISRTQKEISTDFVIASADYAHVEKDLLEKKYRNYSESYWNKKTFSPSSLIFYLGINKKINKLLHHNLFFDEDIVQYTKEIFEDKKWPEKPLFYVCCPSKTDNSIAPQGKENIFILIPIPIGVEDTEDIRQKYFDIIISRLETYCEQKIKDNIEYYKSYCIKDFEKDYNSYKGNAYGLANTLIQTANLKPKIINKKVSNLYYTGQLTVPGPGVPPSIISGKLVADCITKYK